MLYDNYRDNIERELNKRVNLWINRLNNCRK